MKEVIKTSHKFWPFHGLAPIFKFGTFSHFPSPFWAKAGQKSKEMVSVDLSLMNLDLVLFGITETINNGTVLPFARMWPDYFYKLLKRPKSDLLWYADYQLWMFMQLVCATLAEEWVLFFLPQILIKNERNIEPV